MSRVAFTLRIPLEERRALEDLSKIEGRPVNQLVNEAIKAYVGKRGQKERSLEETLEKLRAYRKKDPKFQRAMDAFIEAEATLEDPLEGEVVEGKFVEGEFQPTGPAQRRIRDLLGA